MSKFTSNYAVDLLIRGLDENPDLNKIVYYAISDQYSGAATALSGSLSDVPVVRETIKNAGVVKIDHSIKNELVDTVINVLDPEVKSNNINRRVRSLIDDVLNFAAQKDGSNDILSMFQNVIPVEVTAEHPDTDWDSVLYWILVRSVLVPIVKIPLDKNGKPIIIQDTKKESTSKKATTFGKRVARMGEEPQKEKKGEPESKETHSEPIVDKPEEKGTPEPNFVIVDSTKPTPVQAVDTKTGDIVKVEVVEPITRQASAKTYKPVSDTQIITTTPIDTAEKSAQTPDLRSFTEAEFNSFKTLALNELKSMNYDLKLNEFTTKVDRDVAIYSAKNIIQRCNIYNKYEKCPKYYKDLVTSVAIKLVAPDMDDDICRWGWVAYDRHAARVNVNRIHKIAFTAIVTEEFHNGNLVSYILDRWYRFSGTVTTKTLIDFTFDYFNSKGLDVSCCRSQLETMLDGKLPLVS